MLSFRRIKALLLHGKPRPDANSVRGFLCKNKACYSPETQHGRQVIKVYRASFTVGGKVVVHATNLSDPDGVCSQEVCL